MIRKDEIKKNGCMVDFFFSPLYLSSHMLYLKAEPPSQGCPGYGPVLSGSMSSSSSIRHIFKVSLHQPTLGNCLR